MKRQVGFFERVVVPPNDERRRVILTKLARMRGVPHAREAKGDLRNELMSCNGHTQYFYTYKGIRIALGSDFLPKKHFLIAKSKTVLQPIISKIRKQAKTKTKVVTRSKIIQRWGKRFNYDVVGGVLQRPNVFGEKVREFKKIAVGSYKAPNTKDYYIGLEMELTSKISEQEVIDRIVDMGLHDKVRVMRDGSLRVTDSKYPYTMEFCILIRFSELEQTLKQFEKVLKDDFLANTTCGLHVHLDMRTGDYKRSFSNLVSMQSLLYGLAEDHRRNNRYCAPVQTDDFDQSDTNHHHAGISSFSFYKHKTIEIRIHHGTTNLQNVSNWIKLLKKIADYRGEPLKLSTYEKELEQLQNKIKAEPELIDYVKKACML